MATVGNSLQETKNRSQIVKLVSCRARRVPEGQTGRSRKLDQDRNYQRHTEKSHPEEQILRCRWILTWRPLDNAAQDTHLSGSSRTHKPKARLVVLGYLDPKLEEVPRDSPTLNKTSRMIVLQP